MEHHLASAKLQLLTSSDPRVRIGCYTYGNPRFMLWNEADQVTIGKFCSIAENVVIFGGGEHRSDWVTTFPIRVAFGLEGAWKDGIPTTKGVTIVGNDVWIGYGATILSGVRIGDGAIIGACSVIAQDVPPYGIVAGNPVEVIRFRFTPEVISELLKIKWWDWSIDRIIEAADLLSSPDINAFLEYVRENK